MNDAAGADDQATNRAPAEGLGPEASAEQRLVRTGRMIDLLHSEGVSDADIASAAENHHLSLLAIERLARPGRTRYDIDEMAEMTGITPDMIVRMWRSFGLTEPRPGDRTFNDADGELLATISRLLEIEIIDDDLTMQMSRVIGSSLARVASALVDTLDNSEEIELIQDDEVDPAVREQVLAERSRRTEQFAPIAPILIPTLLEIMSQVWRRHLQASAEARLMRSKAGVDRSHLVVGFADLVGFTALSQQIGPHELAEVVERFETLAYDTIGSLGGRVVKMIGDEVMFAVPHERPAAEIALRLAEGYAADDDLSDVRVALAAGPVLQREADLFGPVVNLAARVVGLAFPASVVCTAEVRDALVGDVDYEWRDIGNRRVKDIGRVPLYVLRRAEAPERPRSRREQVEARLAARQEARLAEMEDWRTRRRRRRGDDGSSRDISGESAANDTEPGRPD